jgi:alpha/beta superfamily hydrolase
MIKKILISILMILMMFSLLLLGCKDSTVSKDPDKTEAEEESVILESEEADDAEEESAVDSETDSEVDAEEDQVTEEAVEEDVEEDMAAEEGEVTFMTEDDVELNGNIFGSGNKWVILSHMYPTDQTSWFDFAEMLKENGYIILTYDYRGYGKSGGSQDVSKLVIDLTAALTFIKQYDPELIYLMGGSMGGTASLVVAAEERIDGVISFSSPAEFEGISSISVIGDIVAPKLFIASQGDEGATQSATEMFEKSMEPKSLEILDGNSHGTFIFEEEPENAEKVKEIVLNFLY